eukprot:scaffold104521_cov36-Cyclotella_meneghiniana.AAC.1
MTPKSAPGDHSDNEFQSQPCLDIQYTYLDALEQSSCCEATALIQNTFNDGVKRGDLKLQFSSPMTPKSAPGDHSDSELQSQPCLAIQYTNLDALEQPSCCEVTALIQNTLNDGVTKHGDQEQRSSSPMTPKSAP